MNPVMVIHKETGNIWRATSGKVGWKQPQHAKAAWQRSYEPSIPKHLWIDDEGWRRKPVKFNDQDEYEIIFIDEALKELCKLRELLKVGERNDNRE